MTHEIAGILWLTGACAALVLVIWFEVWFDQMQKARRLVPGCCTSCNGSGRTYDPSTSGFCWDCQGTGHTHVGRCK